MNTNLRRSIIGLFAIALLLSGSSVVSNNSAEPIKQFNQDAGMSVDSSSAMEERISRARTPEWFRMRGRIKAC